MKEKKIMLYLTTKLILVNKLINFLFFKQFL